MIKEMLSMINIMELGKRIKLCRKEQGYSQEEFSEKLDVVRQTVSKWESGDSENIPLYALYQMCEIFDCDIGYLFGEYDTKRKVDINIQKEIGLEEEVIKKLRFFKRLGKGEFDRPVEEHIDIINKLLGNYWFVEGVIPKIIKYKDACVENPHTGYLSGFRDTEESDSKKFSIQKDFIASVEQIASDYECYE